MVTKEQIKAKLKNFKFSSVMGSGHGAVYHQIPFEEFNEFSPKRLSSEERLLMMLKHYNFHGKKVFFISGYLFFTCCQENNSIISTPRSHIDCRSVLLRQFLNAGMGRRASR